MTTAYTSLLGLALPVTGELSGTWGDTVNNSITSLLDTAVAGTTTLSADADVTLSTTTGAANQSRQAIILWTASGTVTRTITVPAQSKIYTVINRSTTQSIKIVGVGPTTGITVGSGATVTVAWNGLDFVEISVSTLYPTVTISGNMDNGTTDNSLNNAPTVKSAVTSLASVYLSNPSTEAASFTLTNLIGYRAEQGTIGASSTVTNQYGFYANSDLTGAQFNYGLYSGLAATAAVTISSVNGTGSTVTVDTATSHGLVTGDSVLIAEVSNATMTAGNYNGGPYTITLVDANTFTFNSTATSSAAVTSGGNVVKSNNWNVYAGGTGNNWFGGPIINSVSSTLPALRITQTGTGDALLVEDSSNPDSTPFVITASGDVIIGGTAAIPSYQYSTPQLNVMGGSAGAQKGGQYTIVFANDANGASVELGKSRSTTIGTVGTIVQSGDELGIISFNGDDGTDLRTPGATIRAQVDGTPGTNDMPGRLVFSTTADGASSPTERIRIDSAGQTKFSYNAVIETTDNTNAALRITQLGTGNALLVEDSSNPDSTPFVITASGDVGIGTPSPTSLLTVNGESNISNVLFKQNVSAYTTGSSIPVIARASGFTGVYASGSLLLQARSDLAADIAFITGTTPAERMRINSSGNVGIGTMSPQSSLSVGGGVDVGQSITSGYAVLSFIDPSAGSARYASIRKNYDSPFDFTIRASNSGVAAPTIFEQSNSLEAMRITSAGNVGIGTNSPVTKLVLAANNSGLAENNTLRFWDTDTGTEANQQIGKIEFFSSDISSPGAGVKAYIGAFATDTTPDVYLSFATDAQTGTPTERMRIDFSGNVGIGTTSPQARLDLGDGTSGKAITWGGSSGTARYANIFSAYSSGSLAFGQGFTGSTSADTYVSTYTGSNANTGIRLDNSGFINFFTDASSSQTEGNAFTPTPRMRIDSSGNLQVQTGAVMPYAPTPASISGAGTLTNANIRAQIINTTGTTYTVTMALGTTLETLASWATTGIGYDFYIVNTASGTITLDATEAGVTSVGTMTIATGVSAQFRIRRTAANTFVVYRLG
jgi:hypothetical protein